MCMANIIDDVYDLNDCSFELTKVHISVNRKELPQ